jgi:hypothetical protein
MSGPAYYAATINIAKNEDWIVPFVYGMTDPDTGVFTPIDLTGSEIKLEIRKNETDHTAIVSVNSPDNGVMFTDIVHGAFQVVIERDALIRLSAGTYVADLVRLAPNGWQERLFEGNAVVVEGTTR